MYYFQFLQFVSFLLNSVKVMTLACFDGRPLFVEMVIPLAMLYVPLAKYSHMHFFFVERYMCRYVVTVLQGFLS